MKNILNISVIISLLLAFVVSMIPVAPIAKAVSAPTLVAGVDYVPGELLVKFKTGFSPDATFSLQYGIKSSSRVLDSLNLTGNLKFAVTKAGLDSLYLVKLNNSTIDLLALVKTVAANLGVEYAEPNFIYTTQSAPNDPAYQFPTKLWGLNGGYSYNGMIPNPDNNLAGTPYAANINFQEAWDFLSTFDIENSYDSIEIAVVDTGIDYNHPDLIANIPIDKGRNFIGDSENIPANFANPMDYHGHGTRVAGIIGARGNNGIGITGVNWRAKLVAVKVFDSWMGNFPQGNIADIIQGIAYAAWRNIKVMNLSFGGNSLSESLLDTMQTISMAQPNTIFIAAAGQINAPLGITQLQNNDITPFYPASYPLDNIIAVTATSKLDNIDTSNYGKVSVDLSAPGEDVLSTYLDPGAGNRGISGTQNSQGVVCYFHIDNNGIEVLDDGCLKSGGNGSSYSTAYVSGVVSLYWSINPVRKAYEVKNQLLIQTDKIIDLEGKVLSGGRLNLYKMLGDSITAGTLMPRL